jgi:hypothetical protein
MASSAAATATVDRDLRFPLFFSPSAGAMYITVQNHQITNHSTHQGTLISSTFISNKLQCFYYEITVEVSDASAPFLFAPHPSLCLEL